MTYRKALDKMDRILEQNLLYDFYGELLTEHQQRVYEDAVYNDMSLSEIAGEQGISRQGVHDLIKRCDRILQDYESKLHLVERFMAAKEKQGPPDGRGCQVCTEGSQDGTVGGRC